ncbi:MAG TPA: hypothetical protein VFC85_07380 [Verrucomicrobiae bacterium]|nr:hypothetical protein [Verrucomicrobiae bacterium]
MKILLDECVPLQVRDALPNHKIRAAVEKLSAGEYFVLEIP